MSSPGKSQKEGRAQAEVDARPQFAGKRHGGDNDGTSSAEPRVLTGQPDGDSTFSNDPDEGAKRAREADKNRQGPARKP